MIYERTYLTTKAEIKKLLASTSRERLFWFVECKLPGAAVQDGKPLLQAANYPQQWIPVIPVGEDSEQSEQYAQLLMALFRDGNPGRGIEYALALTNHEKLADKRWYEFGQNWDCICAECGQVFAWTAPEVNFCEECYERLSTVRAGDYSAQPTGIMGNVDRFSRRQQPLVTQREPPAATLRNWEHASGASDPHLSSSYPSNSENGGAQTAILKR